MVRLKHRPVPVRTFRKKPWHVGTQPLRKAECMHCGHAVFQRRTPLSAGMVQFLGPLLYAKKPMHKRQLRGKLSNVTYALGHFLQYWGLIVSEDPHGTHGPWRITDRGRSFALGQISVPAFAIIAASRVKWYEGEPVVITDTLPSKEYEQFRKEYITTRR